MKGRSCSFGDWPHESPYCRSKHTHTPECIIINNKEGRKEEAHGEKSHLAPYVLSPAWTNHSTQLDEVLVIGVNITLDTRFTETHLLSRLRRLTVKIKCIHRLNAQGECLASIRRKAQRFTIKKTQGRSSESCPFQKCPLHVRLICDMLSAAMKAHYKWHFETNIKWTNLRVPLESLFQVHSLHRVNRQTLVSKYIFKNALAWTYSLYALKKLHKVFLYAASANVAAWTEHDWCGHRS